MQRIEFTSGQQIWGLAQKGLLFKSAESKESITVQQNKENKYKSCSKQYEIPVSFSYVLDV